MARRDWLNGLIAPLHWLELARGWRRVGLLGIYLLVLVGGGAWIARESVVWRLPDTPEPVVLARAGHVDLADADNAMTPYAAAARLLTREGHSLGPSPRLARQQWNWSSAIAEVRSWQEANRAVLGDWLDGSRRGDALLVQPQEYNLATPELSGKLKVLAQIGVLEATRLQAEGDLDEAWVHFRAALRSGWHLGRNAGVQPAYLGAEILRIASQEATGWVDDPRQTAARLRQAVADLRECQVVRWSPADLIRVEYLAERAGLRNAPDFYGDETTRPIAAEVWLRYVPGYLAVRSWIWNEPERSERILRLITAGLLAQVDRPVADRPRVVSPKYMIFAIDAATPPSVARIEPEILAAWADASRCRMTFSSLGYNLGLIRAAIDRFDGLRLHLAERAYSLDHGGNPARSFGDLLPAFLDRLPEGVTAGDLLIAP